MSPFQKQKQWPRFSCSGTHHYVQFVQASCIHISDANTRGTRRFSWNVEQREPSRTQRDTLLGKCQFFLQCQPIGEQNPHKYKNSKNNRVLLWIQKKNARHDPIQPFGSSYNTENELEWTGRGKNGVRKVGGGGGGGKSSESPVVAGRGKKKSPWQRGHRNNRLQDITTAGLNGSPDSLAGNHIAINDQQPVAIRHRLPFQVGFCRN